MHLKSFKKESMICDNRAQAMLIMVMVLGASMLAVSAIVGYVTVQELRNAGDIANSTEAIYAADAGIQQVFYALFVTCATDPAHCALPSALSPAPTNGATASISASGTYPLLDVKTMGHAGRVYRSLEFSTNPATP